MRKFVKRTVLLGLAVAAPHVGIMSAQQGFAQDREFPVLNTIGRYLGVGYTRAGYHAAQDGRFDIVSSRHPASDYRPSGLPVRSMPYVSGAPIIQSWQAPPIVSAPNYSAPAAKPSGKDNDKPTDRAKTSTKEPAETKSPIAEVIETPKPLTPPKPSGPPPSWLKDYLKDEKETSLKETLSPKDNIETKAIELEKSPSDVLLKEDDSSLLPATGVTFSIIESNSTTLGSAQAVPTTSSNVNRYRGPQLPGY